jgi:hypothetical protein
VPEMFEFFLRLKAVCFHGALLLNWHPFFPFRRRTRESLDAPTFHRVRHVVGLASSSPAQQQRIRDSSPTWRNIKWGGYFFGV